VRTLGRPDSFCLGLPHSSLFSGNFMTIASADVLSSHLRPLCWRDNHVMKSEPGRSCSNAENQASYHCGFEGYSVRYNSTDGYYMLIGMPPSRDTTIGCIAERVSMPNRVCAGVVASKVATMVTMPAQREIGSATQVKEFVHIQRRRYCHV
jgi:hypothetical protein